MPYLRANFTCVTTIHCANFGSEPFLTTFSCYILSLLSLLYTVTSIPYDMEVIVQLCAHGEDSLYTDSYIHVAVPLKEDSHEEQPLVHEEHAHKEHAHKGHAHEEQPLVHEAHAHEEQPLAHEECAHKGHAHEGQPFAHKEPPFAHEEQYLTYKEHTYMVHETDSFTTGNNAGWQYEYLPSNSFMVHKVNYNEQYAIPSNVY